LELVEPVLPEKGFALENHQRHAIVAAFALCVLVCGNQGVEPLCLRGWLNLPV
jgi:hypothetical protein